MLVCTQVVALAMDALRRLLVGDAPSSGSAISSSMSTALSSTRPEPAPKPSLLDRALRPRETKIEEIREKNRQTIDLSAARAQKAFDDFHYASLRAEKMLLDPRTRGDPTIRSRFARDLRLKKRAYIIAMRFDEQNSRANEMIENQIATTDFIREQQSMVKMGRELQRYSSVDFEGLREDIEVFTDDAVDNAEQIRDINDLFSSSSDRAGDAFDRLSGGNDLDDDDILREIEQRLGIASEPSAPRGGYSSLPRQDFQYQQPQIAAPVATTNEAPVVAEAREPAPLELVG